MNAYEEDHRMSAPATANSSTTSGVPIAPEARDFAIVVLVTLLMLLAWAATGREAIALAAVFFAVGSGVVRFVQRTRVAVPDGTHGARHGGAPPGERIRATREQEGRRGCR